MNSSSSRREHPGPKAQAPREGSAKHPMLLGGGDLAKLTDSIRDSIARRAYEIFDARGRDGGRELADWFEAESELLHPLNEEITESKDKVTIRAVVSGFGVDDLEIGIEPRRIVISGEREEHFGTANDAGGRATARMLSVIGLPVEVDPHRSTASLQGKELTIALPKAEAARAAGA